MGGDIAIVLEFLVGEEYGTVEFNQEPLLADYDFPKILDTTFYDTKTVHLIQDRLIIYDEEFGLDTICPTRAIAPYRPASTSCGCERMPEPTYGRSSASIRTSCLAVHYAEATSSDPGVPKALSKHIVWGVVVCQSICR